MDIGALGWIGSGITIACIVGIMLWRAAKRTGIEQAARDMQESTDIATQELERRAKEVRNSGTAADDDYL